MRHDTLLVTRMLAGLFVTALVLPQGLAKVLEWKSERATWSELTAKTPFRFANALSFFALTSVELISGCLGAAGVLALLVTGDAGLSFGSAVLAACACLALFFVQRLARDDRASATALFFGLTVGALALLG